MQDVQKFTTPLVRSFWPQDDLLRGLLMAIAGSALLAVSAWLQVPMWPVPTTMQTFAVLLIGATCGLRLGAAMVSAYLLEAALGLPVLAGFKPLALGGPTFGYLVGFLLAVITVAWAAQRGWTRRGWPMLLIVLLLGQVLIYLPGLAWLYWAWLRDVEATFAGGLLPFVLGDALKLLLAAACLRLFHRTAAAQHYQSDTRHADD